MNQLLTRWPVAWARRLFSAGGQQWLAGAGVALSLLPFVVLAFDSHPALDDFSDAVMRQRLGFWGAQRDLYTGWTGRFTTSVLLTDFSPLRWASWPSFYFLVPLVTLLALAGSLFALVTTLAGGAWAWKTRALAVGVGLSLWLAQAPSVAECLYWYNGVAVYSLPDALFLLWLAALMRLLQGEPSNARHRRRWAETAALSVLVIGSNEVVALLVLAGLVAALRWTKGQNNRQAATLLWLLLLAAPAAAVAFLAPGNMHRLAIIEHSVHFGWAAVGMMGSSAYLLANWLISGFLLAATMLALPALARLAALPGTWAYRLSRVHPLVLAGGLLALLVLTGLPSYWATGGMMPLRARTAVYLLFLVGWLAVVLAGMGWAQRFRASPKQILTWPRPLAALLWMWLLLSFVTDHNVRVLHTVAGVGSNNVVLAYRDWLSGAAGCYDAQMRARYRLLRAAPDRRLRLAPLAAEPPTLIYYDITTDSTYWGNIAYAQHFGQRTVWIGPGGHRPPP